jgi:hypothetical protein
MLNCPSRFPRTFSGDFLAVALDRKDQFAAPNLASFGRVIAAGGELVVLPLHQIDDVLLSSNHWITKKCAKRVRLITSIVMNRRS